MAVDTGLAEPFEVSVPIRTVPDDDLDTALVAETDVDLDSVAECEGERDVTGERLSVNGTLCVLRPLTVRALVFVPLIDLEIAGDRLALLGTDAETVYVKIAEEVGDRIDVREAFADRLSRAVFDALPVVDGDKDALREATCNEIRASREIVEVTE